MILSCVMIVKDEEELLGGAIASLPVYDELVIVDTGSTDGTVAIAQAAGARVEHFKWTGDFSAARNFAESKCTGDYVYWQDADEVLVAGHDIIKMIVDVGADVGVRPFMIFERDDAGNVRRSYPRQELLHRRGAYTWKGERHEGTYGAVPGREEPRIQIEQRPRAGGDRTWGDPFAGLRAGGGERDLFYLAREHSYAGNHYETIALVDFILSRPATWAIQRSDAAMLKGNAYKALGDVAAARAAYLEAVREWGAWAEPYYALGVLHYELEQWAEGAAWLSACVTFGKPIGYFVNDEIYDWRGDDMLARCLFRIGDTEGALKYGGRALEARPTEEHLARNVRFYQGEDPDADPPAPKVRRKNSGKRKR